jgi:hypothetical protein
VTAVRSAQYLTGWGATPHDLTFSHISLLIDPNPNSDRQGLPLFFDVPLAAACAVFPHCSARGVSVRLNSLSTSFFIGGQGWQTRTTAPKQDALGGEPMDNRIYRSARTGVGLLIASSLTLPALGQAQTGPGCAGAGAYPGPVLPVGQTRLPRPRSLWNGTGTRPRRVRHGPRSRFGELWNGWSPGWSGADGWSRGWPG